MSRDTRSRAIGLSLSLTATVVVALLLLVMVDPIKADPPEVFAQWDFEAGTTEPNVDLVGNAEASAGDGLGVGDFAGGNGSIHSWRFDGWTTGARDNSDYFQFKVDLSEYGHITLSYVVKRSNTGPTWLDVRYNTDCSEEDAQAIPGTVTIADNAGWRAHSFDLGSGTPVDQAIRGKSEVCFRIYGFYAESETGTWQIDDVTFHAGELNALQITKSARDRVSPNEAYTYTLYITNSTGISTTGTIITDSVPANATFVSGSASDGGTLIDDSVVAWTVPGSFTAGMTISRTFQVTAGTHGVDIVNHDYAVAAANWPTRAAGATVTTAVVAPGLAVEKTGPEYVIIGDNMVYTITLSNVGDVSATNVMVTDRLPTGTTYLSDNSGVVATNPLPDVHVWSMGDLLSNTASTFNLTVTVNSSLTAGTVLTNEVEVSTDSAGDFPDDNIAQWETTALEAVDLFSSTKMVEPVGSVKPGDYLTYTISLSNSGALDAAVTLTDTLPDGLVLVQGLGGGGVTWSGTVTAGEELLLYLVVQADPALAANTTVSNVVTIDDGLNAAFEIHSPETPIVVVGPSVLSITKSVEAPRDPVYPGDPVTYTIAVSNGSEVDVIGVVVTDNLPLGVMGEDLAWSGPISAGQKVEFIIQATVTNSSALLGETLVNTAHYSCTSGGGSAQAAFTILDAWRTYVPWIMRND